MLNSRTSELMNKAKDSHREFRFTSKDGLQIARSHWQGCGPACGVIQVAHGLGEHSGRYSDLIALISSTRASNCDLTSMVFPNTFVTANLGVKNELSIKFGYTG
jgi:hypothetical protein